MQYSELTTHQRFILRLVADTPDIKLIGLQLRDANYLSSLGILRHAGNLRYEATEQGLDILKLDPIHTKFALETIE